MKPDRCEECGRDEVLTRFKGKYLCPLCLNPVSELRPSLHQPILRSIYKEYDFPPMDSKPGFAKKSKLTKQLNKKMAELGISGPPFNGYTEE